MQGVPWTPRMGTAQPEHNLQDVLCAFSFGRPDDEDYKRIGARLAELQCCTVGATTEWKAPELVSLIRNLKLPKRPSVYVAAIGAAIGHDFDSWSSGADEAKVFAGQGSGWRTHCSKVEVSDDFSVYKWMPDAHLLALLPSKGSQDILSVEETQLGHDLFFITMHLIKEDACGDYLPHGMAKRIAHIWIEHWPPATVKAFKGQGHASRADIVRALTTAALRSIVAQGQTLRHQNGRAAKVAPPHPPPLALDTIPAIACNAGAIPANENRQEVLQVLPGQGAQLHRVA